MLDTKVPGLSMLEIPAEEAYNALRTNIQFCGVVNKLKTITVTSCNPGEGKTTVSFNLAKSMAKADLKTLLVDTDLRRPYIAKLLGIDEENETYGQAKGITDFISGEYEIEDIIYETPLKNLFVIHCGTVPPNPAELLSTEKFSRFIEDAKNNFFKVAKGQFDMIIFDSPPLGSVIDAAVLAAKTDGTLLVVKARSVNYKAAKHVKEQLDKVNANLVGVVLNRVQKKDYGYYYSYYYYYRNDIKDNKKNHFQNC
jgi:protein-tyrosine kinase